MHNKYRLSQERQKNIHNTAMSDLRRICTPKSPCQRGLRTDHKWKVRRAQTDHAAFRASREEGSRHV
jgi:hypothetical protein